MLSLSRLLFTTLIAAGLAWNAEPPAKAPVAANPVVQITGRITRVNPFGPGSGMPSLTVEVNGVSTNVLLGSFRYLMEQNFNPRAGAEVQVKGYKLPSGIVAIEVRLPVGNKTIRLRDENGWPVWRGGGGCINCGSSSTI